MRPAPRGTGNAAAPSWALRQYWRFNEAGPARDRKRSSCGVLMTLRTVLQ